MAREVAFEEAVLAEDLALQAVVTIPGLPLDMRTELHVRADRLGVALRRELTRFLDPPLGSGRRSELREALMGKDVAATQFSREDRTRYRQKVRSCLDVFERMLAQSQFDFERPLTGVEIELNLVDDAGDPAMRNAEVLDAISHADFQTELGQFNVEINVQPRPLAGESAVELEQSIRDTPQPRRGARPTRPAATW